MILAVGLATQAAYFSLQLSALFAPTWLTTTILEQEFTFSLTHCTKGTTEVDQFSPECILNVECEKDKGFVLCPLAKNLKTARDMYFAAAVISLVATLFSSLSTGYRLFGYYNGPKETLWSLLGVQTLAAVLGLTMWFGETKVSFSNDGLRPGTGVYLGIASVISCCISASVLLYASISSWESISPPTIGNQRLVGLNHRQWLLVKILPLVFISIVFDVCSLSYSWIRFSTSAAHEGSLTTLDKVLSFTDVDYSCVADRACDDQTESLENARNCEAFPRLYTSGVAYFCCDGLCLLSMLLWTEGALYYLRGAEYGVPMLNYVWPGLSVFLKGFGLCLWFAISGASFAADCEVSTTETDIQFCAVEGPIYALWEMVCLITACALYLALYRRRRLYSHEPSHSALSSSISPLFLEDSCKPYMNEGSEHFTYNQESSPGLDAAISVEVDGSSNPLNTFERSSGPKGSTAEGTVADILMKETKGMECIACKEGKSMDDIRFELPCGHWCHIECFGVIGYNRKNCSRCHAERQRDT